MEDKNPVKYMHILVIGWRCYVLSLADETVILTTLPNAFDSFPELASFESFLKKDIYIYIFDNHAISRKNWSSQDEKTQIVHFYVVNYFGSFV